ncbi:helicase-related protein [Mesorhizobium mediterraneum]|uniref:helicase-related protein n=1 Tax=Mesorhizobium mediterraneum TaxID=43617 RepID=UPI001AED6C5D|nr:helicase-related protein [Mesorhizobium mediterraneum]
MRGDVGIVVRLEELRRGVHIDGLSPAGTAEVISVDWLSDHQLEVTYRTGKGLDQRILVRDDQDRLLAATATSPFSFDGNAENFRLAAEAHRITLAHLFDPYLALTSANIEALPHQITAVYGEMLERQPLRFLLADDPGAGKTIMAGLFIKELMIRGDLKRCMIVAPGSLVEQWQDELKEKFDLDFKIVGREMFRTSYSGNPFNDEDRLIVRLDMASRSEDVQALIEASRDFDLVICDEAHRMSASYTGGEVKYTKRFQLGRMLGRNSRHFLLMTATPHNGKDDDFQLFLTLLDNDRFEGAYREGVRTSNASDLMRRLIKEELYWFDGRPLFPERRAYTVSYPLSAAEADLYASVTDYVREEMNRAERFANSDEKKRNNVGFALQSLQRRLASSPRAIWHSLKRRRERLQKRLEEEQLKLRGGTPSTFSPSSILDVPGDDDLEEMPEEEVEALENEAIDTASSARTLEELKIEIESLKVLEEKAFALSRSGEDTKWTQLAAILDQPPIYDPATGRQKKILLFTEPRDTLDYLREKIVTRLGDPEAVKVIHGGVPRQQRRAAVAGFNDDPKVRVLIANDAAGEGVNLQRGSHLMVNYDLPWNPNRLEQRFGRIHRIGQTEVCHLWNLVAGETREGAVYQRLLEKLEEARKALGGKVYDVLGEAFEDKSLKDLLMEAVRYGDREDIRARLFQSIDGVVDQSHLNSLTERAQLSQETLNPERVQELKFEMERAHARRLQPYYVRMFFAEAFRRLGGEMVVREEGRWEILRVPVLIRGRDHLTGHGDPVLERYGRVCFDKTHMSGAHGQANAALIAPGHPLLQAVGDLTIEYYGAALKQGAVLVSETAQDGGPRLLVMAEHEIKDAVTAPDGQPRVISKRLQFVSLGEDGGARDEGAAPYLDLRPLTTEEYDLCKEALEANWLKQDLLARARTYVSQHLVTGHLDEVRTRRLAYIRKVEEAVRVRLKKEIAYWSRRADQHRLNIKTGKDERLALAQAEERASRLADRLELRLLELKKERDISAASPIIRGGALVIPAGLLAKLKGETVFHDGFAEETEETELLAMNAVMEGERAAGRTPVDVSMHNRGWDIESATAEGELLFLEVKGRVVGGREIIVTKNEMLQARNAGDRYHLVYVPIEAGFSGQPRYLCDPARHLWEEGEFKDICRHYAVKDIVALATTAPKCSGFSRQ